MKGGSTMESSVAVEKCLYDSYKKKFLKDVDEMKMHKLMYFLQREALMENGAVLFDESFHGWKFGPVLKSVRSAYKKAKNEGTEPFQDSNGGEVGLNTKAMVDRVVGKYGNLSSWKLSTLSHDELSWRLSRRGLKTGQNGDVEMDVRAMKCDAAREKARRNEEFHCAV